MIGNQRFATLMILLAMLTACGTLQVDLESSGEDSMRISEYETEPTLPTETEPAEAQPTEASPSMPEGAQRYTFNELGISLEVPEGLYVQKNPVVSLDDPSKLESYLFYIQNYGFPGGPASGDFQIYGLLQYGLPPISWEEFATIQDNSQGMYQYVNYIEVGGLRGFEAQFSGERNRFVYLFYLEQHILNIAVSEPTPENKAIADQIIATLQYDPQGYTDASHMKLVSDPNRLYQLLIPDDWEYTFQPTLGTQLSSLEVSSPDLEVFIDDEVEGPHSNIYYKQGIALHIQVIDDDSIQFNPGWPDQQEYVVYFNGIEGTVYVFREPSTVEGEIRSVSVTYEGKSYLLRFGYAQDADLDTIDRMIANFNITPEMFYRTP